MDDGSDLAIISGSGKLPLLIKNAYKNAINFSFAESEKETENKFLEPLLQWCLRNQKVSGKIKIHNNNKLTCSSF